MDSEAYQALAELNLPEIQPIALDEFERGDESLLHAKQNRTLVEYYFTCTPSLPLFVLKHYPQVDLITYLDADLFFYSDPSPLFAEMGAHSVAIIGHRFPKRLQHLQTLGIYNVGWLSFRRDDRAHRCLLWWRERCNRWCTDRPENGRFADQKYLDDWPTQFEGVIVLLHRGANVAPWNLVDHQVRAQGGELWVEDQRLIFFHFHALSRITEWLFDSNLAHYDTILSSLVRHEIYGPYLRVLREVEQQHLRSVTQWKEQRSLVRHARSGGSRGIKPLLARPLEGFRGARRVVKGLLMHQYLIAPKMLTTPSTYRKRTDRPSPTQRLLQPSPSRTGEGGKRTKGLVPTKVEGKPLVSVVTVVLDGEKYLEQAVQSVISQPYEHIEYIVIDGGSKDGTLDIVKRYEQQIDYWVSEPDEGIYDAMNKGWTVSRGDYVYYLGADDVLLSLPVALLTKAYRHGVDMVYGDVFLSNGRYFKSRYGMGLLLNNTLHHQGLFLKRTLFDGVPFRKQYRVFSDFDLNQRLYKQRKTALAANEPIALFRLTRTRHQSRPAEFFQIVRDNFGLAMMVVSYFFLKLRGLALRLQGWGS